MTWDHPRGYEPLRAASALWRETTGVEIVWEIRSLQDFESYPLEKLAERYDLMIIDHPHVGQATAAGGLAPMDVPLYEVDCAALSRASVGPSWRSYRWRGRQWALPVDAAAQVQAWRPDLIERPAATWEEALELARRGLVLCPLRPPHSLLALFTICANLGRPVDADGPELFDLETAARAYALIKELTEEIEPACLLMDPIAALEALAKPASRAACIPLTYGYVSYAKAGFRPARLRFSDMPVAGARGPIGSTLGGTGIAVSAASREIEAATRFAFWVAGAAVQNGVYASSGGQPGHAAAWLDGEVNAAVADFYRSTWATLDGAWVRPRHDGFTAFQSAASERLNAALTRDEHADSLLRDLNSMYRASLPTKAP
jgi:multiple sugar transport system substrate-binding protein